MKVPALTLVMGFFLVYSVLIFCGLFFPPALPEVTENRPLAPPPAANFSTEAKRRESLALFNRYLMDRIPLRNILYILVRSPKYFIFGLPADSDFIEGRDGFLFQKWIVNDYLPLPPFSPELVEKFIQHFDKTLSYFEKLKIECLYVLGPVKANLYRDRMPLPPPQNLARGEIFAAELSRRYPQNTVNLFPVLRDAEASHRYHSLFYRQDEHWSKEGAGLSADAVLKSWNPRGADWGKLNDTSESFLGDITAVLGLYRMEFSRHRAAPPWDTWTDVPPAEVSAIMTDPFLINIAKFSKARSGRRILIIGNSIGWNFYPYFGAEFKDVIFVRNHNFNTYSFKDEWVKKLAEFFKPDVVLFIFAEDKVLL